MPSHPGNDSVESLSQTLPALRRRLDELAASPESVLGLTQVQFQLLECLQRHGPLTNAALCQYLQRAQSSVSELTDRLVARGLLSRTADSDRRKRRLCLEQAGVDSVEQFRQMQRNSVTCLLNTLDDEARVALTHHLGELLRLTTLSPVGSGNPLN